MRVLVLQHHPAEGPGTLGGFLAGKGAELCIRHLHRGEALPSGHKDYGLIVVMGGPMNVYEEDKYPWLGPETRFLTEALEDGAAVVGVCLGSQLMAKALGAGVGRSPVEELGFFPARLTPEAQTDPVFAGLETDLTVFQWHGDMFELPRGGKMLVTGDGCPNQGFVWGRGYALQFHVEVTLPIVESWCETDRQREEMAAAWPGKGPAMNRLAEKIYDNLWDFLTHSPRREMA